MHIVNEGGIFFARKGLKVEGGRWGIDLDRWTCDVICKSNNSVSVCLSVCLWCPIDCSRVETAIEDLNLEAQQRLYRSRG